MFNTYTPLQYIQPASPTAQQSFVQPIQYNTQPTPVNYGCTVNYKSPITKGYTPVRNLPSAVVSNPVQVVNPTPAPVVTTPAPVQTVTSVQVVAPRSATNVTRIDVLDNGWSDTNQVRIDNDLRVVSFEYVETIVNLQTKNTSTTKSDEIASQYFNAEQAKAIVNTQLNKVARMPGLSIELKTRTTDESFVRVLFNYTRDLDMNSFYSFNGYMTIYSNSDQELDLISDILRGDIDTILASVPKTIVTSTTQVSSAPKVSIFNPTPQSASVTLSTTPVQSVASVTTVQSVPNMQPTQTFVPVTQTYSVAPQNTPVTIPSNVTTTQYISNPYSPRALFSNSQ